MSEDPSVRRRKPRSDGLRNRERVLEAARAAFATEGPSVSLDDIARRAGVGPGTVHRHFPTKEELFRAIIAERLLDLAAQAEALADAPDPGRVFFEFFQRLAATAREHQAVSAAFASPGDVGQSVIEAGQVLQRALGMLLARAQQAGAVRADINAQDLHAIIGGAVVMEQRLARSPAEGRGLAVVIDGLRA